LEITTPTHPHTSKKHGNGQAECGEWCFHRESLERYIWDEQVDLRCDKKGSENRVVYVSETLTFLDIVLV
jgi:hypothetical protein